MALLDRDRLTAIGRVAEARGLRGALKVRPLTDDAAYYEGCRRVIVDAGLGLVPRRVRSMRAEGGQWTVELDGVASREAAEALRGAELLLFDEELRPLGEDEVFTRDLLGCEVVTTTGEVVGRVAEVLETGASDVLEVHGPRGTVLVPYTEPVVTVVDTAARRIEIDPPPGLLDMNT